MTLRQESQAPLPCSSSLLDAGLEPELVQDTLCPSSDLVQRIPCPAVGGPGPWCLSGRAVAAASLNKGQQQVLLRAPPSQALAACGLWGHGNSSLKFYPEPTTGRPTAGRGEAHVEGDLEQRSAQLLQNGKRERSDLEELKPLWLSGY